MPLRRVLCKTRLIFPRIHGPNVSFDFHLSLLLSVALFLVELFLFLCLSLSLYSKFVNMTIILS